MNDHEAERIAAAINQLRPDWPVSSLLTLIRKSLLSRPRRDVAVALAWIACDAETKTPARVTTTGPWWKAAGVEVTDASRLADRGPWCKDCGTGPDSSIHRSGECQYVLWPVQFLQERERQARLAELREIHRENRETPPLASVKEEPVTCTENEDCIRGYGHTGPHLGPLPTETEPATEGANG